ncbi:hypothetical protein Scep_029791 [Stephania cephalantha]|uniref:Uncharacterized protein n=1 Tax=Stephania cephalantha TaxID=152367 RepID=A0AAP0DYC6_9MAGN
MAEALVTRSSLEKPPPPSFAEEEDRSTKKEDLDIENESFYATDIEVGMRNYVRENSEGVVKLVFGDNIHNRMNNHMNKAIVQSTQRRASSGAEAANKEGSITAAPLSQLKNGTRPWMHVARKEEDGDTIIRAGIDFVENIPQPNLEKSTSTTGNRKGGVGPKKSSNETKTATKFAATSNGSDRDS